MGNEQNRLSPVLPQLEQVQHELFAREGIKGSKRLVHEQDWWIMNKCATDAHALAHSAG
jgi:hypothetical protein